MRTAVLEFDSPGGLAHEHHVIDKDEDTVSGAVYCQHDYFMVRQSEISMLLKIL